MRRTSTRRRDARSLAKAVHADVTHGVGQSRPPRPAETSTPKDPRAAISMTTLPISRASTMPHGTLARFVCRADAPRLRTLGRDPAAQLAVDHDRGGQRAVAQAIDRLDRERAVG